MDGEARYDACVPALPGLEVDHASGVRRMTISGGAYLVHTQRDSHWTLVMRQKPPRRANTAAKLRTNDRGQFQGADQRA